MHARDDIVGAYGRSLSLWGSWVTVRVTGMGDMGPRPARAPRRRGAVCMKKGYAPKKGPIERGAEPTGGPLAGSR